MTSSTKINLPSNKTITLTPKYFCHIQNGKLEKNYQTEVTITQLSNGLKFNFYCHNNFYLNDNTYTENNSEMWNQEVFEIFIAAGSNIPKRYFEIEINPNNAIYADLISNNDLTGSNNAHLFLDAKANGITYVVNKNLDDNSYYGEIFLPFTLIGKDNNYRINFFRVISKQKQKNEKWACTPNTCLFLAFHPTMSESSPQFHLPKKMCLLSLRPD